MQFWGPLLPVAIIQGSASGVTGTSATTDDDDVSSAVGVVPVVGASATTDANDLSAASGTTTVTGSSATTDANDASSASGTTTVTGASASVDDDDISTASGSAGGGGVSGTSATVDEDDVSSAIGFGFEIIHGPGGGSDRKRYDKDSYMARLFAAPQDKNDPAVLAQEKALPAAAVAATVQVKNQPQPSEQEIAETRQALQGIYADAYRSVLQEQLQRQEIALQMQEEEEALVLLSLLA